LKYSSGPDLQFTYNSLNRLASANDLSFAYDPEGRVTNTISSGVSQGAAYDADGRLTSIACQNGAFTVNYTYDSRDRLTQVSDTLTGTQVNFNYDDAGRLTGITRPNGVNGTYTYDATGRLTRIQEGVIIDIQYGYDAAGEVTNANFTAPLDPANFLAPSNPTFGYDAAHQIMNPGFGFDARGRQTASPGHAFSWDGASRLAAIDAVTLGYNGVNDLVTRAQGGVTTRYFYNHALGLSPIVAEKNEATGQVARYYVWSPGGRLLYLIDATSGNAVRFFHFDRVGSTLALTAGNGSVTDAYAYSPYGVPLGHTGTSPQPFTYVGKFGVRNEPAAGLYHMRARYYDPLTARFLSRDPIGPKLEDIRSLDPYQYAAGNPLTYIDPVGLEFWEDYRDLQYALFGIYHVHIDKNAAETHRYRLREDSERAADEAKQSLEHLEATEKAEQLALDKRLHPEYHYTPPLRRIPSKLRPKSFSTISPA
jgi:RHS repeat-associated protein